MLVVPQVCIECAAVFHWWQVSWLFIAHPSLCVSSLNRIAFRNLVGVCYTEDEVKEMAADIDVEDGPNDEGEMFDRPGKLSDKLPAPYANDEAVRPTRLPLSRRSLPPSHSFVSPFPRMLATGPCCQRRRPAPRSFPHDQGPP